MNNKLVQLIKIASPNKAKILLASIFSILNKLCDIVPEILIGISIDVIVNQQNSIVAKMGIINPFYQLYFIGALTALLWILESVFEYLYTINWRNIALKVLHNLRLKTYAHIQNSDAVYFENKTTGQLLSIVQDDINQLEQFLSQGPNEIIQLAVNVIAMGLIFLYLSPTLAILAILPIPFVIAITFYFQNKIALSCSALREVSANLASHIAYRLHGIFTIRAYNAQDYELKLLEEESLAYKKASFDANKINAEFIPVVRMAVMFGFIVSLVVGGIYALQGKIPINWYAALVFLTQRFLWPFTSISSITDMYEKSVACAKRILDVLDTKPKIIDGPNVFDKKVEGTVNFNNVSFEYSNGIRLFDNLNLEIPAKTTVAFVGSTGSGKSTIVKLLLRFYDPQSGTIAIDGIDIKNLKLSELHNAIGYVSQEAYLVEGTIADNIKYGNFNATDHMIIKSAKMAQAHEFIISLPDGYNTKVLEHGKNLSGGQRQRISIARALLKKSPILIFDEATSAVDNETEAAISESMSNLKLDHTIIIIAHRLTTVKNADTIFVMKSGQIVESGTHENLLGKDAYYAKLWNSQLR